MEGSIATNVEDLQAAITDANAAIAENTAWIAEYKKTTEKVVAAVFDVEKVWNLCNTYCVGWGKIAADDLIYVKEQAKVFLYRATNEDDINAAVQKFYEAIDNMDTDELGRLRDIYALLGEAKTNIDNGELSAAVEKLVAARKLFDEIGMVNCTEDIYDVLVIDGVAVDLSNIYCEYRLTIISILIDGAETALGDMDTTTADTNLGYARELIDEVLDDGMTTELEDVDLVGEYNDARIAVISTYLAQAITAIENADFASADDYLAQAREDIDAIAIDTITTDLVTVIESYNDVRVTLISAYLTLAEDTISGALIDQAFIDDAKNYLESARNAIDACTSDSDIPVDVDSVVKRYNSIRFTVVECYLSLADTAINNAIDKAEVDSTDDEAWAYTLKSESFTATISADGVDVADLNAKINAVRSRFHAKYVDLYAAELTFRMNNYIGHLDAIYGDINPVNNMNAIKAEFDALKDHEIYSNYFGENKSAEVNTLVETAAEFDGAIAVRETLIKLIAEGKNVALLIDGYTVEGILGTKTESELIIGYKSAYDTFVANLDRMYAEFEDNDTHKAVYNEIEALAKKTDFDALKVAFDEKIYPLNVYGQAFISEVESLRNYIEDGFKFDTDEKILASKKAKDAWLAQSIDPDGVGFVIEYCSDGEWTHSKLVDVIYKIEGAYKVWLSQAAEDWKAAYTDTGVSELTVNNITIYETRLDAVRKWFDTYPLGADDTYGTEETYRWLTILEARLETLKGMVKDESDRVQGLIDLLGGADTMTADKATVEEARRAYDAWIAGTYSAADVRPDQIAIRAGSGFDTVDITNLKASEEKLAELNIKIDQIRNDIENLAVPTFDDATKNYFDNDADRDAYAASVRDIAEILDAFKAVNGDDLTVFTADELKKVKDCKLYAEKYDSLIKLNSSYNDAMIEAVGDDATLGKLASYYNDAIVRMIAIHSESVFKDADGNIVTATTPSVQIAVIGNSAADDFAAILSDAN